MKKGFMKITKLLVLVAMIFSDLMTPINVLANEISDRDPVKGDVGINNKVSNNGNSATVNVSSENEKGKVEVTKTVSRTDVDGRYKIEFKVKGKDVKVDNQVTKPVYAVVVFDKSASMASSTVCIRWDYDRYGRRYCADSGSNEKWESAVSGAKQFANTLISKIPNAQIALVAFSGNSSHYAGTDSVYDDAEVLRDFKNANLEDAYFSSPKGGTNLQAGLLKAKDLLDTIPDEKAYKYVVVISDGQPTFYYNVNGYTAGDGKTTNKTTYNKTIEAAGDIKELGAEIFSIGYMLPEKKDEDYKDAKTILTEVASLDKAGSGVTHYVDADPDKVASAFTNIATEISTVNAGTNAILTDTIGDNFKVVENDNIRVEGNKVIANIDNITETESIVSFYVDIDQDSPTNWYNTNNGFELNYTDYNNNSQKISSNKNPQVYWVQNTYDYVINYYKDEITNPTDSNYLGNITRKAHKGDVVAISDNDKNAYLDTAGMGYEFNMVDPSSLTISVDSSNNIINVLYTKKKLTYKVVYLFENNGSYTEISSVPSINGISATYGDNVNALTYNNITIPDGYTFNENMTKGNNNGMYSITDNNTVIRLYYDKIDVKYNVVYKFQNVDKTGYEDRPDLINNINNITTKYGTTVSVNGYLITPTGFALNREMTYGNNNGEYVITENGTNIYVYYDRSNYMFNVKYHFNGEFDNTYIYSNDAIYGTTEYAKNYTLDKVNNEHLTNKINNDNKNYFLDPDNNNEEIVIGDNENNNILNVYYISTEFIPNDNNVIENIVKNNNYANKNINSSNDTITYTIKYNFNGKIENIKAGDRVLFTITDTLPGSINTERSNLNGGSYNSDTNTITWVIEETVNEFTRLYEVNNKEINITYSVLYNDYISNNGEVITNNVTGNTSVVRDNDIVIATDGVSNSSDVNISIKGNVMATYKDTDGNTLASNYTNNGLAGSEYTTPQKEIFGYTFKEVNGDDKKGIYVENKELVVNYVYTKNAGNTEEVQVLKTGPEAITDINGKVNYTISGSANVRDYVGDIKVTIKDMLPYAIDEDSSIIPNACTYDGNKSITCVKEYKNVVSDDYTDGIFKVDASFDLQLVFKGINSDTIVNKAQVVIDLDGNKTSSDETEVVTNVEKGNLVVKHISGNTVLEVEDTKSNYGGTSYSTSPKAFYGYSLDTNNLPNNANGNYIANSTITVVYNYIKNDGNIKENTVSKIQNNTINSIGSEFNYVLSYTGKINEYIGEVTLELIDTLPYNVEIISMDNRCTLNGKTIVCRETYNITEDANTISESFDIKLKYLNITGAEVTNNVKSKLYYGNKSVDAEDSVTDTIPYGNVIATYKDTEGNTLASNYTNNGLAGSEYTTPQKEIFGYTFKEVNGDDKEGIYVENKELVVNYVYTKNAGNIEESDVKKDGSDIVGSINDVFNYTITASGEITEYVGNATLVVTDILPFAINEDKSDYGNRCIYNKEDNTITCEVVYNITEEEYVDGVYTINEEFNLNLVFKDIDTDIVVNKVTSNIILDKINVIDEDEKETEIVKGNVITTYKDTDGNELTEEVKTTDVVGKEYATSEKEFAGYVLKEIIGNETGIYTEETIYVEYIYSKAIGTGDIEELPPQTGVESNNLYNFIIIIGMLMLSLSGYKKIKETL